MVRSFLKNLSRSTQEPYHVFKLVNSKIREDVEGQTLHFLCDIDKTYLETDFETPLSLAKIAFEQATDKITVAGATDVLLLARWGDVVQGQRVSVHQKTKSSGLTAFSEDRPRCLHFVSSSPPQLRSVLEEKLSLDGLDWTSDTFKDQVYNIKMGRMDLLRQHVAYKSLAILSLVERADPGSRFVLIGDNAESDIYIYWGIQLLLDGKLTVSGYLDFVAQSGVEPKLLDDLREFLSRTHQLFGLSGSAKKTIEGIYIRLVPGSHDLPSDVKIGTKVHHFESFFQVGLDFMAQGWVSPGALKALVRCFHNQYGFDFGVLEQQAFRTFSHSFHVGRLDIENLFQEFTRVWQELTKTDFKIPSWPPPSLPPRAEPLEGDYLEVAARLIQWIQRRKVSKGRVDEG